MENPKTPIHIYVPGNYPGDANVEPSPPEESSEKIMLAFDIRRFTASMEKRQRDVILFLSEFFDEVSHAIQINEGAFVNKFLGDGILAHIPSGPRQYEAAQAAVATAFTSLDLFKKYAGKKFKFSKMGLSIVISKESIFKGTIGKSHYMDNTILGKSVNRLFRALDSAKGNTVLIFENIKDYVEDTYILVDVGLQTYDGLYTPVELYSVMRKKDSDETGKKIKLCVENCADYSICRSAWEQGRAKKDFINCQNCRHCLNWGDCEVKLSYGSEHGHHSGFQCCHICAQFSKCFHNYYVGKHSVDEQFSMVWCGQPAFPYKFAGVD